MPRTTTLCAHLTSDELKDRYQRARDVAERTRWHALWLISCGKSGDEAARLVGRSSGWISLVRRAYNDHGPGSVALIKRQGAQWGGKKPALEESGLLALGTALEHHDPPGGGLWTGAKVAKWIEEQTGHLPDQATGWRYLQKLGYSVQTRRPAHPGGANEQERATFQKKSSI